ncbi:MAG: tRNA pseudouridine(38-40) synthase TruA [Pseudomonadota bacterium]
MPRYALKVEYNGAPFAGWQRQADQPTVQGAVEAALSKLEGGLPAIAAAGRTDAGVHALGQVAHCDMSREWDPFRLSEALNHHLKPLPVAIVAAAKAPVDWHARFSATARHYRYRIVTRRAPLTHDQGQIWRVPHELNADAMHAAAQVLVGQHDFTTFRSVQCQADSPLKTLDALEVSTRSYPAGTEIHFDVRARSFLHNQVRSFVGTLERVGAGRWRSSDVARALAARDRAACGPVAPPDGLTLVSVRYPEDPFSTDTARMT